MAGDTVLDANGDQENADTELFVYRSKPRAPRERDPDITVTFRFVNKDTGNLRSFNLPVLSETTLSKVRLSLIKQGGNHKKLGFQKDFVFTFRNDKPVPRDNEQHMTVLDILPRLPCNFGNILEINQTFKWSGPFKGTVHYAKVARLLKGKRRVFTYAGIVFLHEEEAGIPAVVQGFSFIPMSITSCLDEMHEYQLLELFEACISDKINVVDTLLKDLCGEEMVVDHRGATPLHYCSQRGLLEICGRLVQERDDWVDLQDYQKKTALHYALYWKQWEVAQHLIQQGADLDTLEDCFGNTCIELLSSLTDEELFKVTGDCDFENMDATFTRMCLERAVYAKHPELVKRTYLYVIDINEADALGKTLLHYAVESGVDAIVVTIASNADKCIRDNRGYYPLHYAIGHNKSAMVPHLLENTMTMTDSDEMLRLGLEYGKMEASQALLKHTEIVLSENTRTALFDCLNKAWNRGKSLLKYIRDGPTFKQYFAHAARQGEAEIVQSMVSNGADINHQDLMGRTALHEAAQQNHSKVVKQLLEAESVNANLQDNNGSTALHYASQAGHLNSVNELLHNEKVDCGVCDSHGRTPVLAALYRNKFNLAKYVIDTCPSKLNLQKADETGLNVYHFLHVLDDSQVAAIQQYYNSPPQQMYVPSTSTQNLDDEIKAIDAFLKESKSIPAAITCCKCDSRIERDGFYSVNANGLYEWADDAGTKPIAHPKNLNVFCHPFAWARFEDQHHLVPMCLNCQCVRFQCKCTNSKYGFVKISESAHSYIVKLKKDLKRKQCAQRKENGCWATAFKHKKNLNGSIPSPLHFAVINNSPSACKKFRNIFQGIEFVDEIKRTPLELAVQCWKPDMVQCILELDKETNPEGLLEMSMLGEACNTHEQECQLKVIDILLAFSADPNVTSKNESLLSKAVKQSRQDLLSLLLEHGASPMDCGALRNLLSEEYQHFRRNMQSQRMEKYRLAIKMTELLISKIRDLVIKDASLRENALNTLEMSLFNWDGPKSRKKLTVSSETTEKSIYQCIECLYTEIHGPLDFPTIHRFLTHKHKDVPDKIRKAEVAAISLLHKNSVIIPKVFTTSTGEIHTTCSLIFTAFSLGQWDAAMSAVKRFGCSELWMCNNQCGLQLHNYCVQNQLFSPILPDTFYVDSPRPQEDCTDVTSKDMIAAVIATASLPKVPKELLESVLETGIHMSPSESLPSDITPGQFALNCINAAAEAIICSRNDTSSLDSGMHGRILSDWLANKGLSSVRSEISEHISPCLTRLIEVCPLAFIGIQDLAATYMNNDPNARENIHRLCRNALDKFVNDVCKRGKRKVLEDALLVCNQSFLDEKYSISENQPYQNVGKDSEDGCSLLEIACIGGQCDVIKCLIEDTRSKISANCVLMCVNSRTPWMTRPAGVSLSKLKDYDCMKKQKEMKGEEIKQDPRCDLVRDCSSGSGCKQEELAEIIKLLVERGADVNYQNQEFGTALHSAAYEGLEKVVSVLLTCGATAYTLFREKYPLELAIQQFNTKTSLVFLENMQKSDKSSIPQDYKGRALIRAASKGEWVLVKEVLKENIEAKDLVERDHRGRTIFHLATDAGKMEVIEQIVKLFGEHFDQRRALLNTLDSSLSSPLWYAIKNQDWKIASVLLAFGSSPCSRRAHVIHSNRKSNDTECNLVFDYTVFPKDKKTYSRKSLMPPSTDLFSAPSEEHCHILSCPALPVSNDWNWTARYKPRFVHMKNKLTKPTHYKYKNFITNHFSSMEKHFPTEYKTTSSTTFSRKQLSANGLYTIKEIEGNYTLNGNQHYRLNRHTFRRVYNSRSQDGRKMTSHFHDMEKQYPTEYQSLYRANFTNKLWNEKTDQDSLQENVKSNNSQQKNQRMPNRKGSAAVKNIKPQNGEKANEKPKELPKGKREKIITKSQTPMSGKENNSQLQKSENIPQKKLQTPLQTGSKAKVTSIKPKDSVTSKRANSIVSPTNDVQVYSLLRTLMKYAREAQSIVGSTILHIAAAYGDLDAVKYIVGQDKSSCLYTDCKSRNAMFYAALNGHMKVMTYLQSITQSKAKSSGPVFLALAMNAMNGKFKKQYGSIKLHKVSLDENSFDWIPIDRCASFYLHCADTAETYSWEHHHRNLVYATLLQIHDQIHQHSDALLCINQSNNVQSTIRLMKTFINKEALSQMDHNQVAMITVFLNEPDLLHQLHQGGIQFESIKVNPDWSGTYHAVDLVLALAPVALSHAEKQSHVHKVTEQFCLDAMRLSQTPLHSHTISIAVYKEYWSVLEVLNLEQMKTFEAFDILFIKAASCGQVKIMENILPHLSNTDSIELDDITCIAFQCSVTKRQFESCRFLLKNSVSPVKRLSPDGYAKFIARLETERSTLKPTLTKQGVHPYWSAFHSACAYGDMAILQLLAKDGSRNLKSVSDGIFPNELPFLASAYGQKGVLDLMIKEGISITSTTLEKDFAVSLSIKIDNSSVILTAAKNGHQRLCLYLLEHTQVNNHHVYKMLFHYAAVHGMESLTDHLLESGVSGYDESHGSQDVSELCKIEYTEPVDQNDWLCIRGGDWDYNPNDLAYSGTPAFYAYTMGHSRVLTKLAEKIKEASNRYPAFPVINPFGYGVFRSVIDPSNKSTFPINCQDPQVPEITSHHISNCRESVGKKFQSRLTFGVVNRFDNTDNGTAWELGVQPQMMKRIIKHGSTQSLEVFLHQLFTQSPFVFSDQTSLKYMAGFGLLLSMQCKRNDMFSIILEHDLFSPVINDAIRIPAVTDQAAISNGTFFFDALVNRTSIDSFTQSVSDDYRQGSFDKAPQDGLTSLARGVGMGNTKILSSVPDDILVELTRTHTNDHSDAKQIPDCLGCLIDIKTNQTQNYIILGSNDSHSVKSSFHEMLSKLDNVKEKPKKRKYFHIRYWGYYMWDMGTGYLDGYRFSFGRSCKYLSIQPFDRTPERSTFVICRLLEKRKEAEALKCITHRERQFDKEEVFHYAAKYNCRLVCRTLLEELKGPCIWNGYTNTRGITIKYSYYPSESEDKTGFADQPVNDFDGFTPAETAMAFGNFDLALEIASKLPNQFRKNAVSLGGIVCEDLWDTIPLRCRWVMGVTKPGDDAWNADVCKIECHRMNYADAWLAAGWSPETVATLNALHDFTGYTLNTTVDDGSVNVDFSKLAPSLNLNNFQDKVIVQSGLVLRRALINISKTDGGSVTGSKSDGQEVPVTKITFRASNNKTAKPSLLLNDRGEVLDVIQVQRKKTGEVEISSETNFTSAREMMKREIRVAAMTVVENKISDLFKQHVNIEIDWGSFDGIADQEIQYVCLYDLSEPGSDGLRFCGLMSTLYQCETWLEGIRNIAGDQHVTSLLGKLPKLKKVTMRYAQSVKNEIPFKSLKEVREQSSLLWDVSWKGNKILTNPKSLSWWLLCYYEYIAVLMLYNQASMLCQNPNTGIPLDENRDSKPNQESVGKHTTFKKLTIDWSSLTGFDSLNTLPNTIQTQMSFAVTSVVDSYHAQKHLQAYYDSLNLKFCIRSSDANMNKKGSELTLIACVGKNGSKDISLPDCQAFFRNEEQEEIKAKLANPTVKYANLMKNINDVVEHLGTDFKETYGWSLKFEMEPLTRSILSEADRLFQDPLQSLHVSFLRQAKDIPKLVFQGLSGYYGNAMALHLWNYMPRYSRRTRQASDGPMKIFWSKNRNTLQKNVRGERYSDWKMIEYTQKWIQLTGLTVDEYRQQIKDKQSLNIEWMSLDNWIFRVNGPKEAAGIASSMPTKVKIKWELGEKQKISGLEVTIHRSELLPADVKIGAMPHPPLSGPFPKSLKQCIADFEITTQLLCAVFLEEKSSKFTIDNQVKSASILLDRLQATWKVNEKQWPNFKNCSPTVIEIWFKDVPKEIVKEKLDLVYTGVPALPLDAYIASESVIIIHVLSPIPECNYLTGDVHFDSFLVCEKIKDILLPIIPIKLQPNTAVDEEKEQNNDEKKQNNEEKEQNNEE